MIILLFSMARITVKQDPKAPGYYFVSGYTIRGEYRKQIRVAGKKRAEEIAAARRRLIKKRK